jgi:hypothetical protein
MNSFTMGRLAANTPKLRDPSRLITFFAGWNFKMNTSRNLHRNSINFFVQLGCRPGWICLGFLALTLTGCSMLRMSGSPPKVQVNSLQLTNPVAGPVTFIVLQQQIMRFADTYAVTVAQACDEISATATNADIRLTALRWKLGQATSAYTDATGQNPAINALDMLVLVSMARIVVEGYGVETYGDTIQPLLDVQRSLETNAWTLAGGVLKPSQQQELRDLIQEWRVKNPHQHYVGQIRFREFVTAMGKMPSQAAAAPTSIFSLLYLDPLAGLDPTAAAIEETRELGERAMYYTQRMPSLLSWQIEVLAYQLAGQPESKQILNDAERLGTSADIFAKTAQQLPQLINDQRQAAIQQVLDGLTAGGDKSRELLTGTRSAFDSAGDAAKSINTAIKSLTEFVQYVSPTNASPASATNSHPFNVLDYGTAASQIGAAANNLNALLASMNQSAPQLEKLSQQTKADADRVVQRVFWLGVVLILILLVGLVVAGLAYRSLANKMSGRKSSEP